MRQILNSTFQCKSASDGEFVLAPVRANIDRLFAGSTVEEIMEALEKDGSEWATKQLKTLQKMVRTIWSLKKGLFLCSQGEC